MISIATNATRNNCEGSFLISPGRDRIENYSIEEDNYRNNKKKTDIF